MGETKEMNETEAKRKQACTEYLREGAASNSLVFMGGPKEEWPVCIAGKDPEGDIVFMHQLTTEEAEGMLTAVQNCLKSRDFKTYVKI